MLNRLKSYFQRGFVTLSNIKGFKSLSMNKNNLLKYAALASKLLFFAVLAGSAFALIVFIYFSLVIPSPDKLTNRKIEQSTKIYDRNNKLLYDVYENIDRTNVKIDSVSPFVIDATLTAEDAEFYVHKGVDPVGLIRAAVNTLTGEGLQGGSTLTQQLTKNALLTTDRKLTRKIKEFILSVQIENKYNKDQILEYYLNEAPYGSTSYGVESAARLYFNLGASELNLAQSAYLAGLTQRPSAYSAFGSSPELGIERQKYILKLMKDKGWVNKLGKREKISQSEYDEAINYKLEFSKSRTNIKAPHFVFYVLDELYAKYGEDYVKSGGLKVTTTLDLDKQEQIEQIVKEELEKANKQNLLVGNSAVVAIDPKNREIITMIGSKDFNDETVGKFNVATSPNRQPGSSIKPLVYATALKQNYTPATVLMDVPIVFKGANGGKDYAPKNYDGKYRGPVQLRYSLANSLNLPAVEMMKVVGVKNVLQTAQDFGITTLNRGEGVYGLSLALGGGEVSLLEMANAYAVFASDGNYQKPISVLKIEDKNGNDLSYSIDNPKVKVLDEKIAFLMSSILSDNSARLLAFGAGNMLDIRTDQVAVKTGTTNDIRDNWTIGYTKDITVGVWAGNNDNTPMNQRLASGVTGAAPIWNRSIKLFLSKDNPNKFEVPKDVVKVEIGAITGGLPDTEMENTRQEYFIKGTEPTTKSDMILELEICKEDNRIANDKCRDDEKTKKKKYIKLTALLPEWQDMVDEWVDKNYPSDKDEFKKFHPPTKKSDYGN